MESAASSGQRRSWIGGASSIWGNSRVGAAQLGTSDAIDTLVFDGVADNTLSVLAAARASQPETGDATNLADIAMKSVLHGVVARGIQVNAKPGSAQAPWRRNDIPANAHGARVPAH